MKPLFSATLILVAAGLVLQGCTEDPTAVGNNLIQSQDIPHIRIDTLNATSHATKYTTISTSASDRLMLGKLSPYEAITLLKFTGLPTSLLDTVKITSAFLQLHSVYHFGDSLAPLAFSVYKAIVSWDTTSFDSLTTQPESYYSTNPISALAPTNLDDTSIVQCKLDTSVVNSWFTPDGSLLNYGLVLRASNVSEIKGFGSFYHATAYDRPTLIINYDNGGVPGTFSVSTGNSRFVASIPQSSLVSNPDLIYVQAGVAFRGQLYFNLENLPKAAQILRADLELTLDGTNSKLNSYAADSLFCYHVNSDSSLTLLIYSLPMTDNSGRKFYRLPISAYVKNWASSPSILQSVQIGTLGEFNSLDLFALYGTLSAPEVRPRLIITSTYLVQ